MNLDLSIHRMAFREAPTLGVAQILVAKKRADLDHQLTMKQVNEGTAPTRAALEDTVADMQRASDQTARQRLDKLV